MDLHQLGARIKTPEQNNSVGDKAEDVLWIEANGLEAWRRLTGAKRYRIKNRKLLIRKRVEAGRRNREGQRATHAAWRENNREHLRATYKENYAKNRDKRRAQSVSFREKHREKINARQRERFTKSRDAVLASNQKWAVANKDKRKAYEFTYRARRRELNHIRRLDPIQRLKDACRTRVLFLLKKSGVPKFNRTFEIIGCSPDFLKAYLESKLLPGMTWDNFGEWEIDHIIPVSKFDISDETQRNLAFNYSNCQALWKPDNSRKCNNMPPPHQAQLI